MNTEVPKAKATIAKAVADDITCLADADEAEFVITKPDGTAIIAEDGKPWTWRISGPSHQATVQLRMKIIHELQREERLRGGREELNESEIETRFRQNFKALAGRVLGWNTAIAGGAQFAFSAENALKIISTSLFIREKLTKFINGQTTFMPASKGD